MVGLTGGGLRAETLEPNSWEDITTYNNFYEFGTGKDDPFATAQDLSPDPGRSSLRNVDRPGEYDSKIS